VVEKPRLLSGQDQDASGLRREAFEHNLRLSATQISTLGRLVFVAGRGFTVAGHTGHREVVRRQCRLPVLRDHLFARSMGPRRVRFDRLER
jgi:hypothetical protein